MPSFLPILTQLRKPPTERVFRPDKINSTAFMNPEVKGYLTELECSTIFR